MARAKVSERELKRRENQFCELCKGKLPRQRFRFCSRACSDLSKKPIFNTCFCGKPTSYPKGKFCGAACAGKDYTEKATIDLIERKRYKFMVIFRKGDLNPSAVLTNKQVKEIRKLFNPLDTQFGIKSLSEEFQVNKSVIRKVIENKTYTDDKYVAVDPKPSKDERRKARGGKLTMEQAREIRRLYQPGRTDFSLSKLGLMFGVNPEAIRYIIKNKTYKE